MKPEAMSDDHVSDELDLPTISRRRLLLAGTGALAMGLVACSTKSDKKTSGESKDSSTSSPNGKGQKLGIGQIFDPRVPVATPLRLPIALIDEEGVPAKNIPATITARVGPKGEELGPRMELTRRGKGLERVYYPFITTLATAGTWRLVVEANGQSVESTLTALEPDDMPGRVIQPGEKLPNIATPTNAAALGVKPICTADPPCPLHGISLDAAMGLGKPIALLVSTPAYCQTLICGPVLDLFLEQRKTFGESITMIHIEVYSDDTAKKSTDTVEALGLTFEPSLFLAAPDGTLSERLDYIFDSTELSESLSRLTP